MQPAPSLSRTVEVETPEQVALGFELADLGSRFMALVLDGLLIGLLGAGLVTLAVQAQARLELTGTPLAWGTAALTLALFALLWGWFAVFEGFREGQTPGKKRAGIRVLHDGGHPLTFRGAAIRNLVRIVDLQPAGTCLVGGFAMMVHPRTKRLGDLAAGTLVVRDRGEGRLPEESWTGARSGPPRLSEAEFEALDRLVARAEAMTPEARDRLVARLETVLAGHLPAASHLHGGLERLRLLHGDEVGRRTRGGAGAGSPQAASLFRQQRERWAEYEALVGEARRRGLRGLDEERLSRFAALYRLVAADLARVRTYHGSPQLAYRLERLVGAGHNLFYRPDERTWSQLRRWLAGGFPRLVRRRRWAVGLAALALFGPGAITYAAVRRDPGVARSLLPAGIVARAELAPERLARGEGYVDPPEVFAPVMSTGIIANNVQVTFMAFAAGVLAGLGTLALLVFNGVFLGAVVALYDEVGAGRLVWGFVAPHGTIELAAICIAGGAGLWMGSALIVPGRLTRGRALAERAAEAVSMLAGTTLLLVLAGLVEGFVSPAPIPAAARLTVAALVGAACLLYLVAAGRAPDPVTPGPGTSRPGSGSPPR